MFAWTKTKEFKNHLSYDWWMYFLSALVICCVWGTLFNGIIKPQPEEKVRLSALGVVALDDGGLEAELMANMSSITKDEVREITVENVAYEDDYNSYVMIVTRSMGMADVMLLSEKTLTEKGLDYTGTFAALDEAAVKAFFGDDVQLLKIDGEVYGVRLNNDARTTRFDQYYNGVSPCYVLFCTLSETTGGWSGTGTPEHTQTLDALKYLMQPAD